MAAPVHYSSGVLGGNSNFTPAANATGGNIDVGPSAAGKVVVLFAWCLGSSPVNTLTGVTIGGLAMTAGPVNTSISAQPASSFYLSGSALDALTGSQAVVTTYTGVDQHPMLVWAVYTGAGAAPVSGITIGSFHTSGTATDNYPATSASGATAVALVIIDQTAAQAGTDVGSTVQRSNTGYSALTGFTGRALDAPGAASLNIARSYSSTHDPVYMTASLAGTAPAAPTVTTQPTAQTVTGPAVATFTYAFANATGVQAERSTDGGSTWSNVSGAGLTSFTTPATTVTGGSANNGDRYRFTGSGTTAPPATTSAVLLTVTASASGTFTSDVLKDNAGTVLASLALTHITLYDATSGALIVRKTGLSTNGSGVVSFTDAAVVAGTTYRCDWRTAAGHYRMPAKAAT